MLLRDTTTKSAPFWHFQRNMKGRRFAGVQSEILKILDAKLAGENHDENLHPKTPSFRLAKGTWPNESFVPL
jgi:hypothetical protein